MQKIRNEHAHPAAINVPDEDITITSHNESITDQKLALSPPKKRLLTRIKAMLPHFEDNSQKQAGANILRFLALMLILTLVARGTSGATLPKVQVSAPQSNEIIQSIKSSGNVTAAQLHDFFAPQDLTIKTILVTAGEKITSGTPLAAFNKDDVDDSLSRAKLELRNLQQKLNEATQAKATGETETSAAQRELDKAQTDYANAINTRKQRENELTALRDSGATPEEMQQAQQQVDLALQTENTALAEYERAQRALDTAKVNDANSQQDANNTAISNQITADGLRLDIQNQQELISLLQSISDNDNRLLADAEGIVLSTAQNGTQTAKGVAIASIANNAGGFLAEAYIDKLDAQKIAAGDNCQIAKSDDNTYSTPQEGKIIAVGTVDEATGKAKISVHLPGQDWKQGEALDLQIIQSKHTHTTCLPIAALHEDNSGAFVYRILPSSTVLGTQNIVEKVPVTIVAKDNKNAAIDGPLSPQDKIIVQSSKLITVNDKVRVEVS